MDALRTALVAGTFYLLTFISSIPAVFLLDPVLHDPNYIVSSGADTRVLWGCFLDLINAVACIGTAVALFPVVTRQNEAVALGFVAARSCEAAVIVIGVVCLLAAVTLRQDLAAGAARTMVPSSWPGNPSSPSVLGRSPSDPASFRASTPCSWATCCTGPAWCHDSFPCWDSSALRCSSLRQPQRCSAAMTRSRSWRRLRPSRSPMGAVAWCLAGRQGLQAVAHHRHRGDGADPTLVADLGVALEQLGGEHDLVTKGGSLELLLGGEGLQLLRCSAAIPLLAILSGADTPVNWAFGLI
jgi:hypothetical protein